MSDLADAIDHLTDYSVALYPDGPYPGDEDLARVASVAGHLLDYLEAALAYGGPYAPATLYRVVGTAQGAATRLAEIATRVADTLERHHETGRLRHDAHRDDPPGVSAHRAAEAAHAADALCYDAEHGFTDAAERLGQAHTHVGHLYLAEKDEPTPPPRLRPLPPLNLNDGEGEQR
ncbi:hypothetical protein GCM10012275_64310 [Longimycelium tulufanense]|uniref:Uncharacterized protein n=1 Tax=Longimycelium tulufanense TaxID=907463 RepID=A0A8J3FZH6_9PSEU|nr:hypothetical protein [Longimycelium tulufanense]GGM84718.1 hypothetical protein GCM10012275_64310 [Longimycelium tulufanense]